MHPSDYISSLFRGLLWFCVGSEHVFYIFTQLCNHRQNSQRLCDCSWIEYFCVVALGSQFFSSPHGRKKETLPANIILYYYSTFQNDRGERNDEKSLLTSHLLSSSIISMLAEYSPIWLNYIHRYHFMMQVFKQQSNNNTFSNKTEETERKAFAFSLLCQMKGNWTRDSVSSILPFQSSTVSSTLLIIPAFQKGTQSTVVFWSSNLTRSLSTVSILKRLKPLISPKCWICLHEGGPLKSKQNREQD